MGECHRRILAHLILVEIFNKTKCFMKMPVRPFQMECISSHHRLIRFQSRLRDSLRVQVGKITIRAIILLEK